MNKLCKRCNIEKERVNFSKTTSSKDGLNSWCKECKREYSKEKYKNTIIVKVGTKNCSKCLAVKDVSEFSKGNGEDGLSNWCKPCHNEFNKTFYIENKERLKPIRKKWMRENKDKIKDYYTERYVEYDKERLSNYYKDNKEEINKKRKDYRKTEAGKKWTEESKSKNSYRLRYRYVLKRVIRRIKLKKNDKTYKILGYSDMDFKIHIESQFTDDMDWNKKGSFEIDHIIPVVAFKNDTPMNIVNSLENLRPITRLENINKYISIDYNYISLYEKYQNYLIDEYSELITESLNNTQ